MDQLLSQGLFRKTFPKHYHDNETNAFTFVGKFFHIIFGIRWLLYQTQRAKPLLISRTSLDCLEVDYNRGSGRSPPPLRRSASVHADAVLCVYGQPVLWRTVCTMCTMCWSPVVHPKCWLSTQLALRVRATIILYIFPQKQIWTLNTWM